MRPRSLTVIVPALNEERGLEGTVRTVESLLPRHFSDWEILIWNDGSRDATPGIAERLASETPRIRAFHHSKPRNLGACYKAGLAESTKEYVLLVPGDNECGVGVLENVLAHVGKADIIIPFPINRDTRGPLRHSLSSGFVGLLNFLSGQRLAYYNGPVLHRTALARSLPIHTNGFGYQAELLVKLLKGGATYLEVPMTIQTRAGGRSKAFRPRNLVSVGRFLSRLCWENAFG